MTFNLLFLGLIATFSLQGTSAFTPIQRVGQQQHRASDVVVMDAMNRRTVFSAGAAAAGMLLGVPSPSLALNSVPADNEIVKEQRTTTDKLDVNNAPVADYMQMPGMYPTIGGKIATSGPYKTVKDVYKLKDLSASEKAKIKEYESELTATTSTGLDTLRGRDPYRRSFNK